jgi:NAD(P)H-dependent FMN reductase
MEELKVAVIYGSNRAGRMCDTVGAWAVGEIAHLPDVSVDVIDPKELDLPNDGAVLKQRIERADAFVVVVPEYNHSYPAALKMLIDSAHQEWQAKPVGFVSYGGISGGLRAVEHLRGVFAELHAVTLRDSVSFANVWAQFGPDGAALQPYAAKTMKVMLRRLRWWAEALRRARLEVPYVEEAA